VRVAPLVMEPSERKTVKFARNPDRRTLAVEVTNRFEKLRRRIFRPVVHEAAPRDPGVTSVRENERFVPRYQTKMFYRFRYPVHRFVPRSPSREVAPFFDVRRREKTRRREDVGSFDTLPSSGATRQTFSPLDLSKAISGRRAESKPIRTRLLRGDFRRIFR